MTTQIKTEINTLGDWATLAIKKHFDKILKHEADVLEDRDPEALHQMRVGMRRLRSAMSGFAPALDLPKLVQEKKIGKIAHKLGELRDLDVLQETLQNRYKPALPTEEQKSLELAITRLKKQRRQTLKQVQETLTGDRYQSFKQSLKKWLKQPQVTEIAQIPIQEVLPDLLLPEVSKLFLHPGWLTGTAVKAGEVEIEHELQPETVEQNLASEGESLHNLRKETKRIRYQMEVFSDFYGASYKDYLADMKMIQEILGQIQDSSVLAEFMTNALEAEIKSELPTMAEQLSQNSYQAWQNWQILQRRYLNVETRKGFHLAILQPISQAIKEQQLNSEDSSSDN